MKKIFLMAIVIALSSNALAINNDKETLQFNCQTVLNKEICKSYNSDYQNYLERKSSFKKNRIRYFLSPELLIEGFSTPLVFNLLLDEVFKNIHKENISQVAISYSKKMAILLNKYYEDKVEPVIIKNKNETNNLFKDDIEYNNELFQRKLLILNWLLKDKKRLISYQKAYFDNKGNSIENCLVNEYKELKDMAWKQAICKIT